MSSPTLDISPAPIQLREERRRFRHRVVRVAASLVCVLGPVFSLSNAEGQSWLHIAFLLSLTPVGLLTLLLSALDRGKAATACLLIGVAPALGWVHLNADQAIMAVMYLVPLVVMAMVVSEQRMAWGLAGAAIVASAAARVARWWLGADTDWGVWTTITSDVVGIIAITALMVEVGLRRNRRDEAILRSALVDVETLAGAARRASDEKSHFLARVSHELRTPLNAILGYTELIQEDEELTEAGVEDLGRVHQSAHQLLQLIDRVLDLSKVEAGHLEMHPERVQVASLVDTVRATTLPLIGRNNNELVVSFEGPQEATIDRARVQQVLLNLVSNAARFTKEGTVTLRVREEPGVMVCEVEDTGIGIAPDRFASLFQPFVNLTPESARDYGGTGLGLSLCDRFVRAMGGHIDVESTLGCGSTFRVVVPTTTSRATENLCENKVGR